MNVEKLLKLRPYAFHATPWCNLESIRLTQRLTCAARLVPAGHDARRRWESRDHMVDGRIWRRPDNKPLLVGRADYSMCGWSTEDLDRHLSEHVFFWPGDVDGPIRSGRNHAKCYSKQPYAFLRTPTKDLFAANDGRVLFCAYNSGAPSSRHRRGSPRGPAIFVNAAAFDRTPGRVVEVVFPGFSVLPTSTQWSDSYGGPWQPLQIGDGRRIDAA